jgi:hypothetical protein
VGFELSTIKKTKPVKVSEVHGVLTNTIDKDRSVKYEEHIVPAASKFVMQVAIEGFSHQSSVMRSSKQQYITTDDLSSYEVLNLAVCASWERMIPIRLKFKTVLGTMAFTTTAVSYGDVYAGMQTVPTLLYMTSSVTVSAKVEALVVADFTSKHTAVIATLADTTTTSFLVTKVS